jgi:uncharacterized protein involved in outer membrane biogenesis
MSTGRKIGVLVVCVIVAFVVSVVFIAPRFVQLNQYRSEVISYIEQQTGRRVEINHLALTVLPQIAIDVHHFAIGNAPGFPNGNWLVVNQINAQLDFAALLRSQVVVRALKLDHPVLDLISNRQGHWNFQVGPPRAPVQVPPDDPPPFLIQAIIKLTLRQGAVSVRELQPNGKPGPSLWNAEGLSVDLGRINAAELNALGTTPSAGSGSTNVQPSSKSTAGQLSLRSVGAASVHATHVQANVQVSPTGINLDDLRFAFCQGQGHGTVALIFGGPGFHYQAQNQLAGVDIAKVLAGFPSARGQMTGTLNSRATFSGTSSSNDLAVQHAEGVLTIRNGTWPKLKPDPTLIQLLKLAKLGSASVDLTRFSLISAQWRLASGVITVARLHIVGHSAIVDGSGTVDLTRGDSLDLQGVLRMAAHRNALSNLLAAMAGGHFDRGRIDVPFVVKGTLQKPSFGLKPNPRSHSSGALY